MSKAWVVIAIKTAGRLRCSRLAVLIFGLNQGYRRVVID